MKSFKELKESLLEEKDSEEYNDEGGMSKGPTSNCYRCIKRNDVYDW